MSTVRSELRGVLAPHRSEVPSGRAFGSIWIALGVLAFFVGAILLERVLPDEPSVFMLWEAAILASVAAFTWLYVRRTGRERPPALTRSQRLRWIGIGAVAVVTTAAVAGAILTLALPEDMHGIGHKLPGDAEGRVFAFVLMVILAPMTEELVFRGWLMRSLTTVMAPVWAVLVSGTVFGLSHIWLAHYALGMGLEIVAVGYALGFLCLHSGSLVPNIAGHMSLNFGAFMSVIAEPVSHVWSGALLLAAVVMTVRWLRRHRRERRASRAGSPARGRAGRAAAARPG